ncbi:MAG TPA: cysteine desulfurase family protein [Bacilli bacterium]|jgi:cysteine desulfurase|nr:cysteine desulfurase family protein [Bacilli bacterium]MDD3388773.1 cysteine desulfurase family protein [Bacilli bacterium]MDD4344563.1 cysteine desulfurase family protein [Bacilli bacterium]MDD4520457.1 cysteine desulfurase family protein [Bacilli bacterium]MDY0399128.1 cysteine desulfurase family protein [Bacilli bacterium]
MNKSIYFDNAATTPVNPEVVATFSRLSLEIYANPHSNHLLGYQSRDLLVKARQQILSLFGLSEHNLIFTSGATESNNLALQGIALQYRKRGEHLITSAGEHPSVLNVFYHLRDFYGFSLTVLPLNEQGVIRIKDLVNALNENTILVSIMAVNNQTGAINPLNEIAKSIQKWPKCFFHSDITQAVGKVELDYTLIDLMSFSAHKIHGFKGSGALIMRKNITLLPILFGGDQEDGLRSGTVAVPLDVSLALAVRLSLEQYLNYIDKIKKIHDWLYDQLVKEEDIIMNSPRAGTAFIINFSLKSLPASVVVEALSNAGIMIASTAACSERKKAASAVVLAMFDDQKRAKNTMRISFSFQNTMEEAKIFLHTLKDIFQRLHEAYL